MLEDIRKDTVDFQPNFDDSEQEPSVLPSRLPNLLLNGSDGIAVGMATRIPPHNLTEVASAIHLYVERVLAGDVDADGRPLIGIPEYMERIKGPDFPTGARIFGIDGIEDMYRTGKGRFHVRADHEVWRTTAAAPHQSHAILHCRAACPSKSPTQAPRRRRHSR